LEESKVIDRMAVVSMVLIAGIYLMQTTQQMLAPVAEEVEYPFGSPWLLPVGLIINADYGIDEEPRYIGEALPGTKDDEVGWRIYVYMYEMIGGDLEFVGLRYAEGNTKFDKVWDNRADYDYS